MLKESQHSKVNFFANQITTWRERQETLIKKLPFFLARPLHRLSLRQYVFKAAGQFKSINSQNLNHVKVVQIHRTFIFNKTTSEQETMSHNKIKLYRRTEP